MACWGRFSAQHFSTCNQPAHLSLTSLKEMAAFLSFQGYFCLSVGSSFGVNGKQRLHNINKPILKTHKEKVRSMRGKQRCLGYKDRILGLHPHCSFTCNALWSTKILMATLHWGLQCNRKNTGVREFKPTYTVTLANTLPLGEPQSF